MTNSFITHHKTKTSSLGNRTGIAALEERCFSFGALNLSNRQTQTESRGEKQIPLDPNRSRWIPMTRGPKCTESSKVHGIQSIPSQSLKIHCYPIGSTGERRIERLFVLTFFIRIYQICSEAVSSVHFRFLRWCLSANFSFLTNFCFGSYWIPVDPNGSGICFPPLGHSITDSLHVTEISRPLPLSSSFGFGTIDVAH